jgi:PTS system mannose-specific IIB component/fructoselysine and glucoselysine-specific PTS system IIB component
MPIPLFRVDDRLIHGQVVIGWGRPLGLGRIVLVDDEVAGHEWEQDLYRMAVPAGIEVVFATVDEAAPQLATWRDAPVRTAVLTGNLETMVRLHAAAPTLVTRVNLGGIHHQPGRSERLPYIYLTDAELQALRDLAADGAAVSAQDVPTASPVPLSALR